MHPWEDALEKRAELEAWWRSPRGEEFSEGWAQAEVQAKGDMFMQPPTIHLVEAAKLAMATPVFIAPDMFELWQHALGDFPSESIEESDLSIPAGFVLLPKPWETRDIDNIVYMIRAFAWTRVHGDKPGVNLSVYIHPEDDPTSKEMQRETYGNAPLHFLHSNSLAFGMNYTDREHWSSALGKEITDEGIANAVMLVQGIQAMWRLAWQQIGKPYALEASRGTRKRFARRWKDRPIPLVTVIALRPYRDGAQKHEADATESQIEYSHRWMVGGHWRNQYYPSIKMNRYIYIAPYVKGPEDRPLVLKDKAYGWVR